MAISVLDAMSDHTFSPLRNKIASFWNNFFADKFEVVEESLNFVELVDGCEYQGWPCGNGKVCLMSRITVDEQPVTYSNENLIA